MSVDTVNYALSKIRLRVALDQSNAYSPEGKETLLYMAGCMRDYLMRENIAGFDSFIDNALAASPDAMSYLLDELFAELGFAEGIREQLSAVLAA